MVEVDTRIINAVKEFLRTLIQQGIRVENAYIYGSYARGKENKWSDVDVAVVSPDISYDRLEERVRLAKLSYGIDARIEPVPFRPDTFVDEDPLVWEIKKEGLPISL